MKILRGKKKSDVYLHFDGIDDVLEYVTQGDKDRSDFRSREKTDGSFEGTKTFDEGVELAVFGAKKITKRVREIRDVVEKSLNITHDLTGYDLAEEGVFFDVGLALEGTPECWFEENAKPNYNMVRICYNISFSASVKKDVIINRGGVCLAIIDMLQDLGYGVELLLVEACNYDSENIYTEIAVDCKPVDTETLAFALAHPSMLRRLWFAILEEYKDDGHCGGYGVPRSYKAMERDVKVDIDFPEILTLCDANTNYANKEVSIDRAKYILDVFEDKGFVKA